MDVNDCTSSFAEVGTYGIHWGNLLHFVRWQSSHAFARRCPSQCCEFPSRILQPAHRDQLLVPTSCLNTFYALNSTKSHPLHRQPVILFYFRWSTYSPSDVCDIPGFAPEGQGQNLLASTAIVFSCHERQSTLIKRPALVKLQLVAERTLAVLSSIAPIWPFLALSARQDLWDLTNVGHPNALLKCHLSIANHCETFRAKALKCTCKMRSAPFCTH